MTWRELARQIMSLPKEVQGQDAAVWLPIDYEPVGHEFPQVIGLCAFEGDKPFSLENLPHMNIEES